MSWPTGGFKRGCGNGRDGNGGCEYLLGLTGLCQWGRPSFDGTRACIQGQVQHESLVTRSHALGAALLVLTAEQAGVQPADNSRVLQGIIAGIGFLGAGTILKGDAESQVRGLTTAAGIWLTAAIGVATGLGRESTALLCTALALIVLWLVPRVCCAPMPRHKPGEPDRLP